MSRPGEHGRSGEPGRPGDHGRPGEHKADFSDIYAQPDPRAYVSTLKRFEYQIPQRATPIFREVIGAARPARVLDVCCSYGINSALLKSSGDPREVLDRYTGPSAERSSTAELAAADRHDFADDLDIVGLDVSEPAIAYGRRAGLLTDGWAENLETTDPSPELAKGIADTGLIISTGGVGYVGLPTFERLLAAINRPDELWLAIFVLRVFDYSAITELLADHGLTTERLPGTYPQRRFADDTEQQAAIHDVQRRGLDPEGLEADGWYHAHCYLTRPRNAG
ncbi:class I SAM-dependent methyltransferase [Saccharopolyspora sp. TS4A08]|uniref:Class I SAM-dependent methyltransferase n=1 Tax=Saccharopolyspora ipomoeae TaxID=3042027 RepID=A0ABT6PMD5_9PSEU|nr:class I SAM-dependent methyltransferase [Saccharopolyspora sp. TS4A08]MDI2029170.1 class I SAM-dependent methyltransferase [Saccharopolyspora sp. TS4A08]